MGWRLKTSLLSSLLKPAKRQIRFCSTARSKKELEETVSEANNIQIKLVS